MDLSRNQTDEVSCDQMCRVLWQGKIWIIVSICLFALVGGYYSLSIKPLWGVSGIVSYAKNTKIIYGKNKNNQGLVDSYYYKGLNENKKNKTIDSIISNKVLFGNFFPFFESFNNKKKFILSSEIVKNYTQNKKIKLDDNFINVMASNMSISKSDNDIYKLKVITADSEISVNILKSYVSFIENKITKDSLSKLNLYFIENKFFFSNAVVFSNKKEK
ncbi:hypothetical protein C0W59_21760, partial [Photobacterium kishitanii]|uniref:Wzz/FepE/Etk N-terminal domain-containing protein n=1 Tax=Photobacterium kishitanii TaxID=318456 RepID=UPI000D3F75E1